MIIERFVMSYITHEPQDTGVPEPIRLKGHGGELVELEGAIDLHLHTYPDLFPRLIDDIELARFATQSKMRAVVIKSHIESSVSRAYLASQVVPGGEIGREHVLTTGRW